GRAPRHGRNVVVVIQRQARIDVRVTVRFPNLIVHQHAIGVADASAPTVRQKFRPLDHGRVIPAESLGDLTLIDVEELWIWTQELGAGNCSTGTEAAACQLRPSDEGIRYRRRQRGRTKRQILRIDLVDIDRSVRGSAEPEMITSGSNVANSDCHIVRELLLDIERILLYPRRFSILIDETDCRADSARGA